MKALSLITRLILLCVTYLASLYIIYLVCNIIFIVPRYESKQMKIQSTYRASGRLPNSSTSLVGKGIIMSDSIQTTINLSNLSFVGIKEENVKSILIEKDSILPVWATPNGWVTKIRYEKSNKYNWKRRSIRPLLIAILICLPYFLLNYFEK